MALLSVTKWVVLLSFALYSLQLDSVDVRNEGIGKCSFILVVTSSNYKYKYVAVHHTDLAGATHPDSPEGDVRGAGEKW